MVTHKFMRNQIGNMFLSRAEHRFLVLLFEKRNDWVSFQTQSIFKSKKGYHSVIKKFDKMGLIVSKVENSRQKKVYSLANRFYELGGWFEWLSSQ